MQNKGEKTDPIVFFASEDSLCPVHTLKNYLERTHGWREKTHSTSLFLSFIKLHKPVTTSTISRWLKSVLQSSGVDTSVFKGHSTRASTSKAFKKGATIDDILSCGN